MMIPKKWISAVVLMLCLLPGAVAIVQSQETPAKESPCCFTNPAYQGTCVVTPAEDETCESILQYLNTMGTVGKSYCETSRVRGGWQKVDCQPAE